LPEDLSQGFKRQIASAHDEGHLLARNSLFHLQCSRYRGCTCCLCKVMGLFDGKDDGPAGARRIAVNSMNPKDLPLRVLFLCTGNSCRSQMAEGWARHLLGNRVEAFSAGTDPGPVNPRAIQVMQEVRVDISSHRSKSLEDFSGQSFDLVITLCDDAEARCPVFTGAPKKIHMRFPDPGRAVGSEETVMEVFRKVRDRIRRELIRLLEEEIFNHRMAWPG